MGGPLPVSLTKKYRPRRFEDVIGQDAVTKSLAKILARKTSHAFLLSGPSGCGKTTLARIAAQHLGCNDLSMSIMEFDAATYTGVDEMRKIQEVTQYVPLGGTNLTIIIDECHMLSKSAWNSLLKITEEPPPHVYWFFCTTEVGKVPPTIKTRCSAFVLKEVEDKTLGLLYDRICQKEGITIPGAIGDLIIREARGSPRQMLANLEICRDVTSKKEAARLLESALDSDAIIELCRFLVKGGSWVRAMSIIEQITAPESARIIVMNYIGKVAADARSDDEARRVCGILEAFATPYNPSEGKSALILSAGRVLLG